MASGDAAGPVSELTWKHR